MKTMISLFTAVILICFLGLFSCEKTEETIPGSSALIPSDEPHELYTRNGANCFNFNFEVDEPVPVGCACIPAPLICPPGSADLCGFGALSFEVAVGDYTGTMTSIVTGLEAMGNPPTGNGALHLSLIHYFESNDGQDAFWTEDQVVCAPGPDPFSCIVNDVLNIAGGCGEFEGAGGKFHNHGVLTFDGSAVPCGFDENGEQLYVPSATIEVSMHGRICFAD
jgi:hypothetical protein